MISAIVSLKVRAPIAQILIIGVSFLKECLVCGMFIGRMFGSRLCTLVILLSLEPSRFRFCLTQIGFLAPGLRSLTPQLGFLPS
jgi:hypothetical protein